VVAANNNIQMYEGDDTEWAENSADGLNTAS
jgi:hypothetical protein